MQNLKKIIIGAIVAVGIFIQIPGANALYSPNVSRQVAVIQGHILSAQSKNGTGDLLEVINSIKAYNRNKRENGEETGISGEARIAQAMILENTYDQAIQDPAESLLMIFNFNAYNKEFISNCLRDEIWNLELVRDVVGQEMVKAYMLYDPIHGKLLEEDYLYLINEIKRLKKYGSKPNAMINTLNTEGRPVQISSNKYYFGMEADDESSINLYTRKYFHSDDTGCPDGEFEQVFEQVANQWKVVETLSSGQGSLWSADGDAWGNIWAMAEANAKVRAKQWIQANQISLTLAGEDGAQLQSLVNGGGAG